MGIKRTLLTAKITIFRDLYILKYELKSDAKLAIFVVSQPFSAFHARWRYRLLFWKSSSVDSGATYNDKRVRSASKRLLTAHGGRLKQRGTKRLSAFVQSGSVRLSASRVPTDLPGPYEKDS